MTTAAALSATVSPAVLDATWDSLTWWDQEDLAEDQGQVLGILDGETGAPRPAWATAQVLLAYCGELEPAPASTEPSDVPFPAVSALYVDRRGPYAALVGETFDVERDARTFEGDGPVVVHPPCGPWGRLAWRCNQDPETARHAVEVVRRNGGVLEHPNGSRLFAAMGIPVGDWSNPERETDAWGGYTIKVDQIDLGHRAIKSTILYIVGTTELPVALAAHQEGAEPHPVQRMGKVERRLTPEALAWALAALAARCVPPVQPTEPEPTEDSEPTTTEAAEASTETTAMTTETAIELLTAHHQAELLAVHHRLEDAETAASATEPGSTERLAVCRKIERAEDDLAKAMAAARKDLGADLAHDLGRQARLEAEAAPRPTIFPAVSGAGETFARHGVLVPDCPPCNGYGFQDGKPSRGSDVGRAPCPACYGTGEDLGHLAERHLGRTFQDLVEAEDEDLELRAHRSSSRDPLELRERRALADLIRQAQANRGG